jgi:RNA polymerase sigma-70 factor (ECF subfamily)
MTKPGYTTHATLFIRINAEETQPRELAWEEFRDRYAPIIAGFARNLGARPQDVDDVIQDVLTGFFASSPTFVYDPSKGRFRAYLKVCTIRALRNRMGKAARLRTVPIEQVDDGAVEFDQAWNDVWEQELLKRALDVVREKYRAGNTFRAFEQYVLFARAPEEVASELGVNVATVYKAKDRVTAALRKLMQRLEAEQG